MIAKPPSITDVRGKDSVATNGDVYYRRTLSELTALQASPEWKLKTNPNNLPACSDPVLVACIKYGAPMATPFSDAQGNRIYILSTSPVDVRTVGPAAEWTNMPAVAKEAPVPPGYSPTRNVLTSETQPNTGFLARDLIAPDARPATVTGLPPQLAAVEQRLMQTWAVANLTTADLGSNKMQPRLTAGVDYLLTNDTPPKLLKMLDTANAKAAMESQFRSVEEIVVAKGNGGTYRREVDGFAINRKADAENNRGEIAAALFAEAAVAFQVKPEARSKEQQELVTYMYSYIAKEAKQTFTQAKAEFTAWTLDTPQGDGNARGDGVMMMFGNTGGQHKAPPLYLMQQSIAGMNMTSAESASFVNAIGGGLRVAAQAGAGAGAITGAATAIALSNQSLVLALTPFSAMQFADEAVAGVREVVTRFVGMAGGSAGGAISVAGIGVALVATAITGVVTDAVNQADGEKMVQYFRKSGPDMSWMNALTSGSQAEKESAMARLLAYSTKMVSAY